MVMKGKRLPGWVLVMALTGASAWCVFLAWEGIWYKDARYSHEGFDAATQYFLIKKGVFVGSIHRGNTVFGLLRVGRFTGQAAGRVRLWYPNGYLALTTTRLDSDYLTTIWDPEGATFAALRWNVNGNIIRLVTELDSTSPHWSADQSEPSAPWIRAGMKVGEWWDSGSYDLWEPDLAAASRKWAKY